MARASLNGRYRNGKNLQTLAYFVVFIVVGMTTASFGPSIPSFARNTGSSLSAVGALFLFHRLGYMIGSLGGGRMLDRLPGNLVTGVMLLTITGGLVLLPLARTTTVLFAVVLVLGLAQGTCEVGANTGVVWLHGKKSGPAMNGLHLSFGVGAIMAPVVLSVSLESLGDIRFGYWFLAAPALPASVGVMLMSTPRPPAGTHTDGAGVARGSRLIVFLLAVVLFFTIAGEAGFAGWVYSYARNTGLADSGLAGYLTAAFWGALTAGRLAGIVIVGRLGARRFLLVNVIGCVLAMTMLLLVPGVLGVLAGAVVLLGLAQATIVPVTFTLAGQLRLLNGLVGGIFVASASAGASLLPWLIGRGFEVTGPIAFVWLVWISQVGALAAVVATLGIAPARLMTTK